MGRTYGKVLKNSSEIIHCDLGAGPNDKMVVYSNNNRREIAEKNMSDDLVRLLKKFSNEKIKGIGILECTINSVNYMQYTISFKDKNKESIIFKVPAYRIKNLNQFDKLAVALKENTDIIKGKVERKEKSIRKFKAMCGAGIVLAGTIGIPYLNVIFDKHEQSFEAPRGAVEAMEQYYGNDLEQGTHDIDGNYVSFEEGRQR